MHGPIQISIQDVSLVVVVVVVVVVVWTAGRVDT